MLYIANLSGGKDSLCMLLKLMELNKPLTHVIMYDAGMEFQSIYNNIDKVRPLIENYGAELIILKPDNEFLFDMLVRPVNKRTGGISYGYKWCGRRCRWQTRWKIKIINKFLKSLNDEYIQYVGIAVDEPNRIKYENNKQYPLVEWNMTEKDCLEYCYSHGWNWLEGDVELYSILDRVSCWCCWNKNLKELKNIHDYLPEYWGKLLGLQSVIDINFKNNKSLFDLDEQWNV